MFYVKAEINDSIEIKVDLYEDEIFCTCPDCGSEQKVDTETLIHVLKEGDLCSTSIFCVNCSKKRSKNMTELKTESEKYHVINMHANQDDLVSSIDELWNFIYRL